MAQRRTVQTQHRWRLLGRRDNRVDAPSVLLLRIIWLSLANGYTTKSLKRNDYGNQVLEEKLEAGFLPFAECPIAQGPRSDQEDPSRRPRGRRREVTPCRSR